MSMQDQGRGLPESDASEIFQPFFTTKTHGLGIGLSICQSIIAAHHGQTVGEAQRRTRHHPPPGTGNHRAFYSVSNSPGLVYLLDDEPGMIKALTRLLHTQGFAVKAFTSVASFLDAYDPGSDSCLVLDVAMPELDGLLLQKRLTHHGILLPIVFLTGHGDIPMSVRAMKAGAVDFLTKPVRMSIFCAR